MTQTPLLFSFKPLYERLKERNLFYLIENVLTPQEQTLLELLFEHITMKKTTSTMRIDANWGKRALAQIIAASKVILAGRRIVRRNNRIYDWKTNMLVTKYCQLKNFEYNPITPSVVRPELTKDEPAKKENEPAVAVPDEINYELLAGTIIKVFLKKLIQ